jgi:hypoxanthine phosphoribosyltransferase
MVLSRAQIEKRVRELAQEITEQYRGRDLVLIGVLNGAFIFLSDLAREISLPVQVDFVRLASYGSQSQSAGRVRLTKDVELSLKDKHALIVEDIVDTGLSLKFLKEHLAALQPASIGICVLVNKKERQKAAVDMDYVGFEVAEGFLVGYGLDFNEQYRCLRDIYHLDLN